MELKIWQHGTYVEVAVIGADPGPPPGMKMTIDPSALDLDADLDDFTPEEIAEIERVSHLPTPEFLKVMTEQFERVHAQTRLMLTRLREHRLE